MRRNMEWWLRTKPEEKKKIVPFVWNAPTSSTCSWSFYEHETESVEEDVGMRTSSDQTRPQTWPTACPQPVDDHQGHSDGSQTQVIVWSQGFLKYFCVCFKTCGFLLLSLRWKRLWESFILKVPALLLLCAHLAQVFTHNLYGAPFVPAPCSVCDNQLKQQTESRLHPFSSCSTISHYWPRLTWLQTNTLFINGSREMSEVTSLSTSVRKNLLKAQTLELPTPGC